MNAGVLTLDEGKIGDISKVWCIPEGFEQWKDYDISVKMSAPSSSGRWNGVLFRVSEDGSAYYCFRFLNGNCQLISQNGQIAILKNSVGVAGFGMVIAFQAPISRLMDCL